MKHKITRPVVGVLAAGMLLVGGAVALSQDDSLISLQYLKQIIMPDVVSQGVSVEKEKLDQVYEDALAKLDQVEKETVAGEGTGLYSEDFCSQDYQRGDQFRLETGSGFLMLAGSATLSHDGTVIDITEGEAVSSGSQLQKLHRYLVAEDTAAQVLADSGLMRAGVQGRYDLAESQEQAAPFLDVKRSDWFCKAVDFVYFNDLFSGVGDDLFAPKMNMNRAMIATVLYHLAGYPEEELNAAPAVFSDVPEGKWFSKCVNWAADQGVTAGTGSGKFSPDLLVTREQMVVLLYNFGSKYMEMDLSERADISDCVDYDQLASWSRDAFSWAVACGVSDPGEARQLNPKRDATRAEAASMLRKFSEKYL